MEVPGVGGTAASALSSIGSDLSVSVSFQVALELVAGAEESALKDDELVGAVLAIAILLAAAKSTLLFIRSERKKALEARILARAKTTWASGAKTEDEDVYVARCVSEERNRFSSERTMLDFSILFISISSRIALSTTVQLLASAARGRQTTRAARVITLVSLSIFFVWIESSATSASF